MGRSFFAAVIVVSFAVVSAPVNAKGAKVRASSSSQSIPSAKKAPDETSSTSGVGSGVRASLHRSSNPQQTTPAAAQPMTQAAVATTVGATAAGSAQAANLAEAQRKLDAHAAEQKRADEQAATQKRVDEQARADAAARKAEERARDAAVAERQSRRDSLAAAPTGCIIKPVMTDAELALCR
jgi:type IV secretory pathway VirB10-like protein